MGTWTRTKKDRGRYEMKEKIEYKIIEFERLESTNEYAKSLRGAGENVFVVAKEQTGGRGTKGRSFSSARGGVYLSRLTFYESYPAKDAFLLMAGAATAVCETLKTYGLSPKIKWPNDVHVNGKKICGILIENSFSGANIRSSVVGVGLNVCNPLPKELQEIATTVCAWAENAPSVEDVKNTLIEKLSQTHAIERYFSYLGYMGEQAEILFGDEKIPARLIRVDGDGRLAVQTADGEKKFSAAEISLKV